MKIERGSADLSTEISMSPSIYNNVQFIMGNTLFPSQPLYFMQNLCITDDGKFAKAFDIFEKAFHFMFALTRHNVHVEHKVSHIIQKVT